MTLLFILLMGLCVGSFLNVVIIRLHERQSLGGRSRCPHCSHTLAWYDLFPVLSFVVQHGRCRYCKQRISWQYPLIELATGLLFLLLSLANLPPIYCLASTIYISLLIVTLITDLRWNLIYDAVLWPGIILALLIPLVSSPSLATTYSSILLAALVGGGVFALQHIVSRGRWVGSGDIILGVFLGLILGFPLILWALFLAYVSGAIVALLLMSLGLKTKKDTLPLGCFLCAAGILLLLIH